MQKLILKTAAACLMMLMTTQALKPNYKLNLLKKER